MVGLTKCGPRINGTPSTQGQSGSALRAELGKRESPPGSGPSAAAGYTFPSREGPDPHAKVDDRPVRRRMTKAYSVVAPAQESKDAPPLQQECLEDKTDMGTFAPDG